MIALITTNPPAVLSVFTSDAPGNVAVPNVGLLGNARAGWQSDDGTYKLVKVTPFDVPDGQQISGFASYTTDGTTVTETYSTQPVQAATTVANATLMGRLTQAEQVAIFRAANTAMAAGNASYMFWLTAANSRGFIDLADPATIAVKAAIVAAGLMTQTRANAVFTT